MPKKYLCLANSLIEQITEGVYPKGCLLPSEREICEKYNISRTTARQALNILAQEGYITSIQGKGTVVTHPQIQQELGTIYSFDEDMRQLGKNPETHIMDFIEMSAPDALAAIFPLLQAVYLPNYAFTARRPKADATGNQFPAVLAFPAS